MQGKEEKKQVAKRRPGRPSIYSPEYFCTNIPKVTDAVIKSRGGDASLCIKLGTNRDTLFRYRNEYPEVAAAYADFRLAKEAFDEQWYGQNCSDKGFNATGAIFYMKNSHPLHWNHDRANDSSKTININNMNVFQNKSAKEIIEHIKDKLEGMPELDITEYGQVIESTES